MIETYKVPTPPEDLAVYQVITFTDKYKVYVLAAWPVLCIHADLTCVYIFNIPKKVEN